MTLPIVQLSGVDKIYGTERVLHNVELTLHSGDRILLYGPNGSGKTTLLKIIASLTSASCGSILYYGSNDALLRFRSEMGYLGHDTLLYPDLTGEENLKFFGALRGVSADQCHYWLEKVGLLLEAFRKPVRFYSAGMQQRLAIGRLFLHDPEVVLLDEPFNALDQSFINLLMQWLRPKTVLLVTHQLDVGRSLATRVFEVCKSQIFEKPVTG